MPPPLIVPEAVAALSRIGRSLRPQSHAHHHTLLLHHDFQIFEATDSALGRRPLYRPISL
jgi:hypothetical protein